MIIDSGRTKEILADLDTDLIICGHTHRQGKTEYNGKTALNPGSLGVPLGSVGKAQFLLLENKEKDWKAAEGVCLWPNIPEKYWEQAIEETKNSKI